MTAKIDLEDIHQSVDTFFPEVRISGGIKPFSLPTIKDLQSLSLWYHLVKDHYWKMVFAWATVFFDEEIAGAISKVVKF